MTVAKVIHRLLEKGFAKEMIESTSLRYIIEARIETRASQRKSNSPAIYKTNKEIDKNLERCQTFCNPRNLINSRLKNSFNVKVTNTVNPDILILSIARLISSMCKSSCKVKYYKRRNDRVNALKWSQNLNKQIISAKKKAESLQNKGQPKLASAVKDACARYKSDTH